MSLNTRDDIDAFKEMGKTFWRLIHEAEKFPTLVAQEAYVRKKMEKIYSEFELNEFYENFNFICQQSANLHQ